MPLATGFGIAATNRSKSPCPEAQAHVSDIGSALCQEQAPGRRISTAAEARR